LFENCSFDTFSKQYIDVPVMNRRKSFFKLYNLQPFITMSITFISVNDVTQ